LAVLDLIYHILFSFWLILLVGGQYRMIMTNMTTVETLKRREEVGLGYKFNPYDKVSPKGGSSLSNNSMPSL